MLMHDPWAEWDAKKRDAAPRQPRRRLTPKERYDRASTLTPDGNALPDGWRYEGRDCYAFQDGDLHIATTLYSTHGECGSWRFHSHGSGDIRDVPTFLRETADFVRACHASYIAGADQC